MQDSTTVSLNLEMLSTQVKIHAGRTASTSYNQIWLIKFMIKLSHNSKEDSNQLQFLKTSPPLPLNGFQQESNNKG